MNTHDYKFCSELFRKLELRKKIKLTISIIDVDPLLPEMIKTLSQKVLLASKRVKDGWKPDSHFLGNVTSSFFSNERKMTRKFFFHRQLDRVGGNNTQPDVSTEQKTGRARWPTDQSLEST